MDYNDIAGRSYFSTGLLHSRCPDRFSRLTMIVTVSGRSVVVEREGE